MTDSISVLNAIVVLFLVFAPFSTASAQDDVTLLMREKGGCGPSSYFGTQLRTFLEDGRDISMQDFVHEHARAVSAPFGANQQIKAMSQQLIRTKVLILESSYCGGAASLAIDARFWHKMRERGLDYVVEFDPDVDGFVWNFAEFIQMVEEGDRVIVFVSGEVHFMYGDYYVLTRDFSKYIDGSRLEDAVSIHGYPLRSFVDRIRELKPSKLNVVIDGENF